jgi:molybdopterin-guanine dinucleotide biosynthesis protein A
MGRDKAGIPWKGRPLVMVVADALATVADPVFLAPGTPARLGHTGYQEIADITPDGGPLAAIAAALRASPHPRIAVVAVDMPFASPTVLRLLASLHREEDAVVPVTSYGPQPLHAVYARTALPALERAVDEGSLSVQGALRALRVRAVTQQEWQMVAPDDSFALNVNRPEDLADLV